jgi:RNA polymerase sigma factor (sigma-70 family)
MGEIRAEDHIKLVHHIAKRYESLMPYAEYEDLVQTGCIGLVKAMKKYDPEKGKFSTYAGLLIEGELSKYLRDSNANNRKANIFAESLNTTVGKNVPTEKLMLIEDSKACAVYDTVLDLILFKQAVDDQCFTDEELDTLRYTYRGLTQTEISRLTGATASCVFQRIVRVRKKFSKYCA